MFAPYEARNPREQLNSQVPEREAAYQKICAIFAALVGIILVTLSMSILTCAMYKIINKNENKDQTLSFPRGKTRSHPFQAYGNRRYNFQSGQAAKKLKTTVATTITTRYTTAKPPDESTTVVQEDFNN